MSREMPPSADKALVSALAGAAPAFSKRERRRFLRRARYEVLPAAKRLLEKHAWMAQLGLDKLDVSSQRLRNELAKGYIRLLPTVGDHDERPITVLTVRCFKPATDGLSTQQGTDDGGSSADDATLCVAYTMQRLLRELDELDADVDGAVFVVDCAGCGMQNLSRTLMERLFSLMRSHYPGVVHRIYVANTTRVLEGVASFARRLMGSETQAKVMVLSPDTRLARAALLQAMPASSLPQQLGGDLAWLVPEAYIAAQAECDGVNIEAADEEREQRSAAVMMGANVALNGMQYANRSAAEIAALGIVLKGPMLRQQRESATGGTGLLARFAGVGWKQVLCLLRPDALLVFFTTDEKTAKRPDEVFPLSEILVSTVKLNAVPTGASAFSLKLQGGAQSIFAAPGGDVVRARWIDAIETSKLSCDDRRIEEQYQQHEFERFNADLLGLDNDTGAASGPTGASSHKTTGGVQVANLAGIDFSGGRVPNLQGGPGAALTNNQPQPITTTMSQLAGNDRFVSARGSGLAHGEVNLRESTQLPISVTMGGAAGYAAGPLRPQQRNLDLVGLSQPVTPQTHVQAQQLQQPTQPVAAAGVAGNGMGVLGGVVSTQPATLHNNSTCALSSQLQGMQMSSAPPAVPQAPQSFGFFPAGLMGGTGEFGEKWLASPCEVTATLPTSGNAKSLESVVNALQAHARAQVIDVLPNTNEAILALRSAADGSLALAHCKVELALGTNASSTVTFKCRAAAETGAQALLITLMQTPL